MARYYLGTRVFTRCCQIGLHEHLNIKHTIPITCGLCGKSNLKYYTLFNGQTPWYYCPECGFSGTAPVYIAEINQCALPEQLRRLVESGEIPYAEENDITAYCEFLVRTKSLQKRFLELPKFNRLMSSQLSLLEDLDRYPPAASYRMGKTYYIEKTFFPNNKMVNYSNSSPERVLEGTGWKHTACIPLYDFPYHVSGFLFVNGRPGSSDFTVKAIDMGGAFDAGYLAPRIICDPSTPAVVLTSDWKLALSLQSTGFRQRQEHLPILGWFPKIAEREKPLKYYWAYLSKLTKVFWGSIQDKYAVREAAATESLFSSVYYHKTTGLHIPQGTFPAAVVKTVIRNTIPWQQALTAYLKSEDDDLYRRLAELNLPDKIVEKYLSCAPAEIAGQITENSPPPGVPKRIARMNVIDKEGGWYDVTGVRVKSPHLLSNLKCYIEKIIHFPDRKTVLQCRITIGANQYFFAEDEDVFEKDPIDIVKQVCVKSQCEEFILINCSKAKYREVVKELSHPKIVHLKDGFGWSAQYDALILPNITVSDETVIDTGLGLNTGPFHTLTAATNIKLEDGHRNIMSNFAEESRYIYAMFCALMPPLFAKAYRAAVPQTLVSGGDSGILKQVFDLLGLPDYTGKPASEINAYIEANKTPFFCRLNSNADVKRKRVFNIGFTNQAFIYAAVSYALARMSYGQANLLLMPRATSFYFYKGVLPTAFISVFTACIKHLSRFVLQLRLSSTDWNSELVDETMRFMKKELGLAPAKNIMFCGYDNPADFFMDYLVLMQQKDLLKPESVSEGIRVSLLDLGDCYRKEIGIFDVQRLYDNAVNAGIMKECDIKDGYFILDGDAFEQSTKRLRTFYDALA